VARPRADAQGQRGPTRRPSPSQRGGRLENPALARIPPTLSSAEGGRGAGELGGCRWISLHPGSRRDKSAVRKLLPKPARE
jgi:hypothetical protein